MSVNMEKDIQRLIVNSIYLYLIQGLNYLLPLLSLPYLLSVLSSESFGIYIYAFSFSQILMLLIDFGFNISVTKKITHLNNIVEIVQTYWTITYIKFIMLTLCFIFSLLLVYFLPFFKIYRFAILISFVSLIGTVFFPIWWFQGLNKMRVLSFINAISKLLTYPFLFYYVKEINDYDIAVFIQSSSFFLAGVLSVFFVLLNKDYRKLSLEYFRLDKIKLEFREAFPIFLSNSSISLYTNSLTIILGFYTTVSNVGMFGAMERIVRVVCFGIYGPINQACFPVISRLSFVDYNKAKQVFKLVFFVVLFTMLLTCISFLFVEDFIIKKFLSEYKDVKFLLRIFIFTIIPIALGGVCGQLGLLGMGKNTEKKIFSSIYIFTGLLSLPFSLFFIYFFNVEGAVFSMMFVEVVIFILMFYYVKKINFL